MRKIIFAALAALAFASCDDNMTIVNPDDYDMVTFEVAPAKTLTRAYVSYNSSRDPQSMGVFDNQATRLFANEKVTYSDREWSYPTPHYWSDYGANEAQFVAYMPHNANATYTGGTLSVPVSFVNGFSTEEILLCNAPTTGVRGQVVPFQMDQALAGYDLQFMLGDKMGALRHFDIKSVKLTGNMPVSGTVSRSYSTNPAGAITWSDDVTTGDIADKAIPCASGESVLHVYKEAENNDAYGSDYASWARFYIIPGMAFTPTITVTYDVYDEKNFVTRKDVVSTIEFNSTNFSNIANPQMGYLYPIKIKIVPDHLYVLSDADQTTGYLVVE